MIGFVFVLACLLAQVSGFRSTKGLSGGLRDASSAQCDDEVMHTLQKANAPWTRAISMWFSSNGGKVKVFEGSDAKWSDMVPKGKWSVAHAYERKRMTSIGRQAPETKQTKEGEATESKVRGICDMSLLGMKWFSHAPQFIDALTQVLPSPACRERPKKDLSENVMSAMQAMCFGSCISTLAAFSAPLSCDPEELTAEFYESVVNADAQCAETPVDTLEWLSAYTLFRRCATFIPSTNSYVWTINDKGPESFSPGSSDAACQLPVNKSNPTKTDITMNGWCPEGSKCKCPMTDLKSRDNARQIRLKGQQSVFSMSGYAAAPTIAKQYATGFIVSTVIMGVGIGGLTLSAAALATLEAPTFLLGGTVVLGVKALYSYLSFQCAQTLGCWPQRPEHVEKAGTPQACRMPRKTSEGGSPLWFLPPPLMKMVHSNFGSCRLESCAKLEIWNQNMGFGNSKPESYSGAPHIYNCQPLTFEEMSPELRQTFIERLENNGMSKEYSLGLAWARENIYTQPL